MRKAKLIGIILLRLVFALVIITQVLLLAPIYSWLNNLNAITTDMYIMAIVKVGLIALCTYWFHRLKSTYTRIKSTTE